MFRSRKLINTFIFSNNHQCNYTKTISCLRGCEYWQIVTLTLSRWLFAVALAALSFHLSLELKLQSEIDAPRFQILNLDID